MARVHGIAVVLCIAAGVGLWFWAAAGDDIAPPLPSSPSPTRRDEATPLDPSAADRARMPTTEPAKPIPQAAPTAPKDAPPPTTPPAEAAPPITIALEVHDAATSALVPKFRWRFRPANGGDEAKGDGADGRAFLALPLDARGQLLVEAEGFTPEQQNVQVPASVLAPQPLALYLAHTGTLVGVTLTARDDLGAEIARLRLDLWQLAAGAPDPAPGEDPPGKQLWTRIGSGERGVFRLPDLPTGRLALRAQAVDEQRDALPLQPWRATFAFGGVESIGYTLDLLPGVVLQLTADDDQQGAIEFVAMTRNRAGVAVPVLWRSRRDSKDAGAIAADALTLPGRAATALALPPGDYALELLLGERTVPVAATGGDQRVRTFAVRVPR